MSSRYHAHRAFSLRVRDLIDCTANSWGILSTHPARMDIVPMESAIAAPASRSGARTGASRSE
jgi:hypothetical protein